MKFIVGREWCHGDAYDTVVKNEYDNYEQAKAEYDRLVTEETNNIPKYGYERTDLFVSPDSKNENTIFTNNENFHIDRNANNYCDIFLFEITVYDGNKYITEPSFTENSPF